MGTREDALAAVMVYYYWRYRFARTVQVDQRAKIEAYSEGENTHSSDANFWESSNFEWFSKAMVTKTEFHCGKWGCHP